MRRKLYKVVNWEKYQSRTDKEMPWTKMWGTLFTRDWWQEIAQKDKVLVFILIEVSRRFDNKFALNLDYFVRNFGISYSQKEWDKLCKFFCDIEFLSDYTKNNAMYIEDKSKIRVEDDIKNDITFDIAHFEEFWASYPKKVAKAYCQKIWKKMKISDDLFKQIMDGLERAKKSRQWSSDNGKFIPYPTTFLNQERWNDDYTGSLSNPQPRERVIA